MWWDDEQNKSVDVPLFDGMCEDMNKQNTIVKELKQRLKDENGTLDQMKTKIMAYMEGFDKKKYSTNFGTIFIQSKFSVKVPKDLDSKQELFKWLASKDIFQEYATVNSVSLNALYRSYLESEGPDFSIPGLAEPTHYQTLVIRS